MPKKKSLITRLGQNIFLRNVVLAVCGIIVFVFLVNIMLNLYTRHNVYKTVPDFSEMSLDEAKKIARKESLVIEVNDSLYIPAFDGGIVLQQLPEAGTNVKSGRRIFVTVNSYRQRMVQVPYVTGFSLRQAKNNLEVAGLEIGKLVYKDDIATNNILETRYDGKLITRSSDVWAEQGSGVMLVVGMRPEESTTTIPKIVGFPLHVAKSRLWEAGLNVGDIDFDEGVTILNRNEARVYTQFPEQGTRARLGANVSFKLSGDEQKVETGSQSSDKAATRIISTRDRQQETQN